MSNRGVGTAIGGSPFFFRDFRNAYAFRPDQDPARHQFAGFVSFVMNRNLYRELYNETSNDELRNRLSAHVRTAEMPGVKFNTRTMNQYNRKKIVNTGLEFNPVSFVVADTVSNSWLTVLMKYYAYHYMNPRNKQTGSNDREIDAMSQQRYSHAELSQTEFGTTKFKSNEHGYNPNKNAYFFERVDYVLYHGQKAVQYSLLNPVITAFSHNSVEYSSNELMAFEISMEYENFTTFDHYNFPMSDQDLSKFDDYGQHGWGELFESGRKSIVGDTTRQMPMFGTQANPRNRTAWDPQQNISSNAPSSTSFGGIVASAANPYQARANVAGQDDYSEVLPQAQNVNPSQTQQVDIIQPTRSSVEPQVDITPEFLSRPPKRWTSEDPS